MLDAETKRHIDNARDVLVGKVPDPKAQIEMITIALIYKFMDDMDKAAIEMGGKAGFFTGQYKEYTWTKLMDIKMSGVQRIKLYSEALEKMPENKSLPQLFRDILKDAFLPFRDPETLNLFLKEIAWFDYEHSENLGNAFEYLLSIMSSQGDAGQFRTPRHIIDFMVDVIAPEKGETILDPACGTAGFLISAYNHILNKNTKKNKGDKLTPDDRKKLAANIVGYDISPDMVRLSRVNLYLHGFTSPKIYEYDTLTSEERWNDNFDVILANPPFMTPKGGIRPHKKFAIQANRSEVLFVDYIAEHVNLKGRAAVIVPEGIIFQSANAYKALRKKLVDENYLWAVVSLPAGVFNPYSQTKTSILFFDKVIAKKVKDILFVKVSNDGFDLGAQRREIEKNDLPSALEIMKAYLENIEKGLAPSKGIKKSDIYSIILKINLAENGDYNFTAEGYKLAVVRGKQKWPMVKLSDITNIQKGSAITNKQTKEGNIPVIAGGQTPAYFHNEANRKAEIITVSSSGAYAGFINFFKEPIFASDCTTIEPSDKNKLMPIYLFHVLKNKQEDFYKMQRGMAQPHVYSKDFDKLEIPFPTIEIQREIVAEIEGYQKIIDGARMVVDNWKPRIDIDPAWPMVKLGELCKVTGELTRKIKPELFYIGADSIESNTGKLFQRKSAKEQGSAGPVYYFEGKKLLYSKIRPYLNKLCITEFSGYCSSDMYPLEFKKDKLSYEYAFYYMLSDAFNEAIKGFYERASIPKINRDQLFSVDIPLPSLTKQQDVLMKVEAEQKSIDSCREMIKIYEDKIKQVIDKVWG